MGKTIAKTTAMAKVAALAVALRGDAHRDGMSRPITRTAALAVAASLLAAACGGSSDPPGGVTGPGADPGSAGSAAEENGTGSGSETGSEVDTGAGGEVVIDLGDDEIVLTASLSAFDECGSLLDHLRSEYAERVGPWGFEGGGYGPGIPIPEMADDQMAEEGAMAETGAAGPDSGSAEAAAAGLVEGVDYSGTNVQEAGVDEADLVKTDGRRIFAVSSGLLLVVDAASRQIEGSAQLAEGFAAEMLLDGDDLLVVMNAYSPPIRFALEPAAGQSAEYEYDGPVTVVQRVRMDGYRPRVVETLRIDGAYVSTRSIDGVARVVTRHDPAWAFPFVYPQGGSGSEEAAEEANRAAVLASTLEDWLPSYSVAAGAGVSGPVEGGLLPACENVYVPTEFAGFGVTTVLSLPVGGPLAGDGAVSVMAPGDTVYASPQSLYVATSNWLAPEIFEDEAVWPRVAQNWRTAVHRFDLTDPTRAAYAASGSVPGQIHNQFSLSEHDGHLRVVTTTGNLWWGQDDVEPSSQVRVLRQTGDRLVEVGSVGDIGRGERVQSVRFTGAVGYVVTFRQVDPFYTLDLSDPENPAIVGELKIPGFSSYLHPISGDLVLGVGFEADESTGAVTGSKVSLFDVSDLADPRELAVWAAPDAWNDAGWDHRAFLWWEPARMAVFGISSWTDQTAEAVALRVERGSITEIGRIDHVDPRDNTGATKCRRLDSSPPAEVKPESDLWYILTYTDAIACDPDVSPGIIGFECWQVDWVHEEAKSSGVIVGDETLFSCQFATLDIIVRSLVIGDELWTLSYSGGNVYGSAYGRLAASDLTTLERTALINLF